MKLVSTTTFTPMTTAGERKAVIGLYEPSLHTCSLTPTGTMLTKVSNKPTRRMMLTKILKPRRQPHHGSRWVF